MGAGKEHGGSGQLVEGNFVGCALLAILIRSSSATVLRLVVFIVVVLLAYGLCWELKKRDRQALPLGLRAEAMYCMAVAVS